MLTLSNATLVVCSNKNPQKILYELGSQLPSNGLNKISWRRRRTQLPRFSVLHLQGSHNYNYIWLDLITWPRRKKNNFPSIIWSSAVPFLQALQEFGKWINQWISICGACWCPWPGVASQPGRQADGGGSSGGSEVEPEPPPWPGWTSNMSHRHISRLVPKEITGSSLRVYHLCALLFIYR